MKNAIAKRLTPALNLIGYGCLAISMVAAGFGILAVVPATLAGVAAAKVVLGVDDLDD